MTASDFPDPHPANPAAPAVDLEKRPGSDHPSPLDGTATPPTPPQQAEPEQPEQTAVVPLVLMVGALLALGLFYRWSLVVVVLAVVVIIALHEFGHFITAKWSGMKVTEFFLGFGPRLWSFRRGETTYGVKGIPAGAYVRIIGMHNLEEVEALDEPRSYRQQSFPKRLLVVSAGSLMHFLIAFVLMVVIIGFTGVPGGSLNPNERAWVVGTVEPGSPADDGGLKPDDTVVSIAGVTTSSFERLRAVVQERPDQTLPVVVERAGSELTLNVKIGRRSDEPGAPGFLGVSQGFKDVTKPLPTAIAQSVDEFGTFGVESLKALGKLFSPAGLGNFAEQVANRGEAAPSTGGSSGGGGGRSTSGNSERPISLPGAVRIGADLSEEGITPLLSFLVLLNIFIGIFNMVPLLPLDGGHAAVAIYERVRSRKGRRYHADVRKLIPVTYAVVAVLVSIGLASLYLDIVDPVSLSN